MSPEKKTKRQRISKTGSDETRHGPETPSTSELCQPSPSKTALQLGSESYRAAGENIQFEAQQSSALTQEDSALAAVVHPDLEAPSTSKGKSSHESEQLLLSPVALSAEMYFLQKDIEGKSEQIKNLDRLSYSQMKGNDKLVLLYTGLPNAVIFEALFELLKDIEIEYYLKWKVENIDKIDQLLMTLMKLRQNFPHADLAF